MNDPATDSDVEARDWRVLWLNQDASRSKAPVAAKKSKPRKHRSKKRKIKAQDAKPEEVGTDVGTPPHILARHRN
jgi:hypothetical protein